MRTLLRKEQSELFRTWRIWVLPLLLFFFAVTSPLLARYQNELLGAVLSPDVTGTLPDPTYTDAYAQWIKNVSQLVTFAVILTSGSAISGELRAGTAQWILAGPITRHSFLAAKMVSRTAELVVVLILGTGLTFAVTRIVFPTAPAGPLCAAGAVWLTGAIFLQLVTVLASALLPSSVAASGVGLGAWISFSILGLWEPARAWSPAGLLTFPSALLEPGTAGRDVSTALATTALLAAGTWILGAHFFQRRDL